MWTQNKGGGNIWTGDGQAEKIYCISDIHGCLNELKAALEHIDLSEDSRLVLLGDYIDYGPQSGETLRYVYELQKQHGAKKVIVLRGNHEDAFLEWLSTYSGPNAGQPDEYGMVLAADPELIVWLRGLPYYYETPRQVFVHAGIDEEAGEWWPWATPEYVFVGKYPAETGRFYKDIIAGHVGTSGLAENPAYHGVWWDGQNHYYIDGSIQQGGQLNILVWDEEQGYRQWDDGWKEISNVG